MYHIFVHLSVGGHLGCFYVLAIINSAVIIVLWWPSIYESGIVTAVAQVTAVVWV